MKEESSFGPKITQLHDDQDFSTKLNSTQRRTWKAFENVCKNFSRQWRAENYSETVQELISSHGSMGCNMSLNFIFGILIWMFPCKHESPLRWARRKAPQGFFPNWKEVQWKGQFKYVGWLLLESYNGDTSWWKQEAKVEVFNDYFLARMPNIETIFKLMVPCIVIQY